MSHGRWDIVGARREKGGLCIDIGSNNAQQGGSPMFLVDVFSNVLKEPMTLTDFVFMFIIAAYDLQT